MSSTSTTTAPAIAAAGGGIPRLIYLLRILWLCFFPVFTVLVGDLVLLSVDQAREALVAFSDDHVLSGKIAFEIAYVLWMVLAWYVARLLLGRRFKPDLIGTCSSAGFARGLAEWLPRALAVTAGLPIPAVLLIRAWAYNEPGLVGLAIALFITCAAVFSGLVFRRPWAHRQRQTWVRNWRKEGTEDFEHFDGLARSARWFIGILFVASFGLTVALPVGMAHVARPVGAPALLLIALMSWNLFGGFALTYLPRSYGLPAVTWIPVVLLLLLYRCNENHPVAPASSVRNGAPQDVGDLFGRWLQRRSDPAAPVIFVATAGGASRAAYWTTAALGMLEDEARGAAPRDRNGSRFADNIFVISSVSGGSLGAAAFAASLDLTRRVSAAAPAHCRKVQDTADRFTGKDHLSTVLGFMLFPDLLERILPPPPIDRWDRSLGLELVWVSDWKDLLAACGNPSGVTNPWPEALTALSSEANGRIPLPFLALNSTAMARGQQVLQAPFKLPRPDVFDVLSPAYLATDSLTLAEAVHNSARFPYVSPGGVVRLRTGAVWDRLGDGGYVEASGALMLSQILRALEDKGLIRDNAGLGGSDGDNGACVKNLAECYIRHSQIRILILDNTPSTGFDYLCGPGRPGDSARAPLLQNIPTAGKAIWPPGPDVLVPMLGAFATRGGRALSAEVDLRAWADGCTKHFAELRLPKARANEVSPSMNWMLNGASKHQIDQVLKNPGTADGHPDANTLLRVNLDIVRTWFAGGARN